MKKNQVLNISYHTKYGEGKYSSQKYKLSRKMITIKSICMLLSDGCLKIFKRKTTKMKMLDSKVNAN